MGRGGVAVHRPPRWQQPLSSTGGCPPASGGRRMVAELGPQGMRGRLGLTAPGSICRSSSCGGHRGWLLLPAPGHHGRMALCHVTTPICALFLHVIYETCLTRWFFLAHRSMPFCGQGREAGGRRAVWNAGRSEATVSTPGGSSRGGGSSPGPGLKR